MHKSWFIVQLTSYFSVHFPSQAGKRKGVWGGYTDSCVCVRACVLFTPILTFELGDRLPALPCKHHAIRGQSDVTGTQTDSQFLTKVKQNNTNDINMYVFRNVNACSTESPYDSATYYYRVLQVHQIIQPKRYAFFTDTLFHIIYMFRPSCPSSCSVK